LGGKEREVGRRRRGAAGERTIIIFARALPLARSAPTQTEGERWGQGVREQGSEGEDMQQRAEPVQ